MKKTKTKSPKMNTGGRDRQTLVEKYGSYQRPDTRLQTVPFPSKEIKNVVYFRDK